MRLKSVYIFSFPLLLFTSLITSVWLFVYIYALLIVVYHLAAHSSQSSHQDLGDKAVNNRYVPNWGLRNDLRVCTFCACRELVSHLATPTEDEFLGNLSNVKVVIRAYQTLGQSVLAQGELLKRHEQLNHDYVDLANHNDSILAELDRLKVNLQWANEDNAGITHQLSLDMVKDLERERDEWRETASGQVEKIQGLEEK
ncbi:hypothetical protein Tco_0165382, partial [Tanacetum coccineum]